MKNKETRLGQKRKGLKNLGLIYQDKKYQDSILQEDKTLKIRRQMIEGMMTIIKLKEMIGKMREQEIEKMIEISTEIVIEIEKIEVTGIVVVDQIIFVKMRYKCLQKKQQ